MKKKFIYGLIAALIAGVLVLSSCGETPESVNSVPDGGESTSSSADGGYTVEVSKNSGVFGIDKQMDLDDVFVFTGDASVSKTYTVKYDEDNMEFFDVEGSTFTPIYLGKYRATLSCEDSKGEKKTFSTEFTVTDNTEDWLPVGMQAAYAATVPVVDGEIDGAWVSAQKFYMTGHVEKRTQARGYVSVMWTESGLYFLAVVYDATVCGKDMVNFWVNEDYSKTDWHEQTFPSGSELVTGGMVTSKYPADGSLGAYAVCAGVDGRALYYGGYDINDAEGFEIAAETVQTDDGMDYGYVIEVYVPVLTTGKTFAENDEIGFNVSIDDYLTEYGTRDEYCNIIDVSPYWTDPSVLPKVTLKK